MTPAPSAFNRRGCSRFRAEATAELRVGGRRFVGALVDESAGGFAVVVEGPLEIAVGQTILVHFKGVWWEARLANDIPARSSPESAAARAPHDSPPGADAVSAEAASADEEKTYRRLGFQRLQEVDPPDGSHGLGWLPSCDWFLPTRRPITMAGFLLSVAGAAVAIFAVLSVSGGLLESDFARAARIRPNASSEAWFSPRRNAAYAAGATTIAPAPEHDQVINAPVRNEYLLSDRLPSRGAHAAEVPPAPLHLRQTVRELPGPMAFELPDVVQYLQLSSDQQRRIEAIIHATEQAVQKLDDLLRGRTRHEIAAERDRLFAASLGRAMEILSEQQRLLWRQLIGSDNNPQAPAHTSANATPQAPPPAATAATAPTSVNPTRAN